MFVCSPVSTLWQPFAFETALGWLEGELDAESGTLRALRFLDSPNKSTGFRREGGSVHPFPALRREEIRIRVPEQPFFRKVYEVLSRVRAGEVITYQELAVRSGSPRAARAVGQAMARNPVCLLIPCHRVVPATGGLGNYRWGEDRKRALLEMEADGRDAWETLTTSLSIQPSGLAPATSLRA